MKTVIELAREAGNDDLFDSMQIAFLERFAEFVRAGALAPQPAQRKPLTPEEIEAKFQVWLQSDEHMKDAPKRDYEISYVGMQQLSMDCMRYAWTAAQNIKENT